MDDDRKRADDGRRLARALRRGARLWAVAVAVTGGVLVVASFLPAFELAITAATRSGRGEAFRYSTEVTLLELLPLGLVPLGAGLLVLAAAVVTIARGPELRVAVGSVAVALGLAWLVVDTTDRLQWSEGGVIGYAESRGGPLLQPVVDDLQEDARRTPEARDPTWSLTGGEHAYASRGLEGWQVLGLTTQALFWLAAYRLMRFSLRPWAAGAVVVAATLLFWVWLFWRALSRTE